jgi:hypothetical protein
VSRPARLKALERRRSLRPEGYTGTYGHHYLEAWPARKDDPRMIQCAEHPPACGVHVVPVMGSVRRQILLSGPWPGSPVPD